MIVPELKLPTDEYYEVVHENDALKRTVKQQQGKIADRDAKIADRDAKLADQNAKLADQDAKIADRDAKIAEYKRLYGDL